MEKRMRYEKLQQSREVYKNLDKDDFLKAKKKSWNKKMLNEESNKDGKKKKEV